MSLSTLSRKTIRTVQRFLPASSRGTVVLAYHLVDAGTSSPVDLPLRMFRSQVEELRRWCEPVSLQEALDRLVDSGGRPPPERPAVVLTFDDAHHNFYRTAWPVLREAGIPATLYVPTAFIDGQIASPIRGAHGLRPMAWDQLAELADSGLVTIGSHGKMHKNLARATRREAEVELSESRERIESRLGIPVDSFCYPEGGWTRAIEPLVGRIYRSAVVAGGKRVHPGRTRLTAVPRVPVRRDMPDSLAPVLHAPVWLEEWLASGVRSLRWRRQRFGQRGSRDPGRYSE